MKYTVKHTTKYLYQTRASLCHNIVYQSPGEFPFQQLVDFKYKIDPDPNYLVSRKDFFGNNFFYFSVQKTHKELTVESQCKIVTEQPSWVSIDPLSTPNWETIAQTLCTTETSNDIRQFYLESKYVSYIEEIKAYALQSFTPNRPIMDAMLELNSRIFNDFTFTPGFTEISTPLEEVFKYKKGVCQDYAHFGLACLRSIGLAARYMSGYIETYPPPGKPKLIGSDASHAWIAMYIPDIGWVEFDSTNNLLVADNHVRVSYGRDFADVVPLKGIVYSRGEQKMVVKVDVTKLD